MVFWMVVCSAETVTYFFISLQNLGAW